MNESHSEPSMTSQPIVAVPETLSSCLLKQSCFYTNTGTQMTFFTVLSFVLKHTAQVSRHQHVSNNLGSTTKPCIPKALWLQSKGSLTEEHPSWSRNLTATIKLNLTGWWLLALLIQTHGIQRRITIRSRLSWSIERVPGQPRLHRQTLSQKRFLIN